MEKLRQMPVLLLGQSSWRVAHMEASSLLLELDGHPDDKELGAMLGWAGLCFVMAIIAGAFGLGDLSSEPGLAIRAIVFGLLGAGAVLAALGLAGRNH